MPHEFTERRVAQDTWGGEDASMDERCAASGVQLLEPEGHMQAARCGILVNGPVELLGPSNTHACSEIGRYQRAAVASTYADILRI